MAISKVWPDIFMTAFLMEYNLYFSSNYNSIIHHTVCVIFIKYERPTCQPGRHEIMVAKINFQSKE